MYLSVITCVLFLSMIVETLSHNFTEEFKNKAVENFREYLQIPSVHPDIDYSKLEEFLRKQASELNLQMKIFRPNPKRPIIVLSWIGSEPNRPSILLDGHMDVVPVFEEFWKYPPFSAHVDEKGNIYARGSQDMKSVSIQYLEAIRTLKLRGKSFKRTIHVSFMPDEETGGLEGMALFSQSNDFKSLNVGFALDEGLPSTTSTYRVFYGERSVWHLTVHCTGATGHGSILIGNTAGEKLRVILNKFMDFRQSEKKKLEDQNLKLGDVTTVNLVEIHGGVQNNVIPREVNASFDIRIDSGKDHKEFENMILSWCKEAGEGVFITFEEKDKKIENTDISDNNIYWKAMEGVLKNMNLDFETEIFQAGTDVRYIRALGIPAIGFSPIINTEFLLHDHNEYLNRDTFIDGIEIYAQVLDKLANLQ